MLPSSLWGEAVNYDVVWYALKGFSRKPKLYYIECMANATMNVIFEFVHTCIYA